MNRTAEEIAKKWRQKYENRDNNEKSPYATINSTILERYFLRTIEEACKALSKNATTEEIVEAGKTVESAKEFLRVRLNIKKLREYVKEACKEALESSSNWQDALRDISDNNNNKDFGFFPYVKELSDNDHYKVYDNYLTAYEKLLQEIYMKLWPTLEGVTMKITQKQAEELYNAAEALYNFISDTIINTSANTLHSVFKENPETCLRRVQNILDEIEEI